MNRPGPHDLDMADLASQRHHVHAHAPRTSRSQYLTDSTSADQRCSAVRIYADQSRCGCAAVMDQEVLEFSVSVGINVGVDDRLSQPEASLHTSLIRNRADGLAGLVQVGAVWMLTSGSPRQLIAVDPSTNTVARTFPARRSRWPFRPGSWRLQAQPRPTN